MASPRKSSRLENRKSGPCYLRKSGYICNCCTDESEEISRPPKETKPLFTDFTLPAPTRGRSSRRQYTVDSPALSKSSENSVKKSDKKRSDLEEEPSKLKSPHVIQVKRKTRQDMTKLFVSENVSELEKIKDDVIMLPHSPKRECRRPPKYEKDKDLFVQTQVLDTQSDNNGFETLNMQHVESVLKEGVDDSYEKERQRPQKKQSPTLGKNQNKGRPDEKNIFVISDDSLEQVEKKVPPKTKPLFVSNNDSDAVNNSQGGESLGEKESSMLETKTLKWTSLSPHSLKKMVDQKTCTVQLTDIHVHVASSKLPVKKTDPHKTSEDSGKEQPVVSKNAKGSTKWEYKTAPEESVNEDKAQVTLLNILKKKSGDVCEDFQTLKSQTMPEVFPMVAAVVSTDIVPDVSNEWNAELQAVADKTEVSFIVTEDMVVAHGNWLGITRARDQLYQAVIRQRGKKPSGTSPGAAAKTSLVDKTVKPFLCDEEGDEEESSEENSVLTLQPADQMDLMRDAFLEGETDDSFGIAGILDASPSDIMKDELDPTYKMHHKGYRKTCTFVRQPERASSECDLCGFKSTSHGVQKHKLRHHSRNQSTCLICKREFGIRYDMRRHRLCHFADDGVMLPESVLLWKESSPGREPIRLQDLEKNFVPQELLDLPVFESGKLQSDSNVHQVLGPNGKSKCASIGVFGDVKVKIGNTASVRTPHKVNKMCALCGFCSTENGIRKHTRRHHPKLAYECLYCKRRFGVHHDLQRHVVRHQNQISVMPTVEELRQWAVCNICSFSGSAKTVNEHIKNSHSFKQTEVSLNVKQEDPLPATTGAFNTLEGCVLNIIDGESSVAIPVISDSTTPDDITESKIQGEFVMSDKIQPFLEPLQRGRPKFRMSGKPILPADGELFECPVCEKMVSPKHFTRHVNSHNKPNQKCTTCSFSGSGEALAQHVKETGHKCKREYQCNDCGKVYTSYSSFCYHSKIHHQGEAESSHQCHLCGKQFNAQRLLNVHIRRVHQKIYKHHCDLCGKGFFEQCRMLQHREIHKSPKEQEENKKFTCSYCGNRFLRRMQLKQHENVHTGNKPYPCPFCPKKFASSSEVHKHKVVHTNRRPFKCTVCSKAFKFRYKLTSHMIIHTKDSQHVCHKCGKVFTMLATLKRHKCPNIVQPVFVQTISKEIVLEVPQGQATETVEQYLIQNSSGEMQLVCKPEDVKEEEGGTQTNVMFMCGVCEQIFVSMDDVNIHMAAVHGHHVELVMGTEEDQEMDIKETITEEATILDVSEVPPDRVVKLLEEAGQNSNAEIQIEIPTSDSLKDEGKSVDSTPPDGQ